MLYPYGRISCARGIRFFPRKKRTRTRYSERCEAPRQPNYRYGCRPSVGAVSATEAWSAEKSPEAPKRAAKPRSVAEIKRRRAITKVFNHTKRAGVNIRLFLGFIGIELKTLYCDYRLSFLAVFHVCTGLFCIVNYAHIVESTNSTCHCSTGVSGVGCSGALPQSSHLSILTPRSRFPLYTRACRSPITQTH